MPDLRTPTIGTTASDYSTFLSESVRIQMADEIPMLMEDVAKYTSLLMRLESRKPVPNPVWYHMEDELIPYLGRWNGATETSAGTTLATASFSNGNRLFAGVTVYVPRSKERFRILTDPSSGNVTATRNLQGTAGLLVNGDLVVFMAPANTTGGTTPLSRYIEPTLKTFRIQNAREAMRITDIGATTSVYGTPRRVRDQKKLMLQHKLGWELSLWFNFGTSGTYGSDTFPTYLTKGVMNFIQTNYNSIPYLTYADFEAALENAAMYHKSSAGWLAVCGSKAMRVINGWGRNLMEETPGANKTFGYTTKSLITSFGPIELDWHPLFTGPYLEGIIVLIPKPITDFIQYRPLIGNGLNHSTKLYLNQQAPGSETFVDEVKTKAGIELWEEPKWAIIEGIEG